LAFNEKYNFDDVFFRACTVGLLNLLNDRVQLRMQTDADEAVLHPVPWFHARYGDERFMQDFFVNLGMETGCGPTYTEGNADPIPRGVISLSSATVNSSALTNKFVRGTYNREVDGVVKAYSSNLNVIPMSMSYEAEVICSTLLEAYKVVQEVVSTFYKAAKISVGYNGFRSECLVGFPQDYTVERPLQFTYGDDGRIYVKFQIEMETYLPVTDQASERFRGNIMDKGIGNVIVDTNGVRNAVLVADTDVDPSLTRTEQSDQPGPDYVAPFGYDTNATPVQPRNSL